MIVGLSGKITVIGDNYINLNVNGVIYEIFCTKSVLNTCILNENRSVLIIHIFKENEQKLYGVFDNNERNMFHELTKVSGVGAKFAINILSSMSCDEIYSAIASNDENAFSVANGVGKKLSARIVNEMQNSLKNIAFTGNVVQKDSKSTNGNLEEVLQALESLGFKRLSVYNIVQSEIKNNPSLTTEEVIKIVLPKMSKV